MGRHVDEPTLACLCGRPSRPGRQRHLARTSTAGIRRASSAAPAPEVDLLDAAAVQKFFAERKPEFVFVAAAKSAGFMPTTPSPPSFFLKTCRSRTTSSTAPANPGSRICCSWAVPASIPSSRPSRSRRNTSSPARWSRPTNGMPSPKSPASNSARPTAASTAAISSAPCRPIFTAPTTTMICNTPTSCRP